MTITVVSQAQVVASRKRRAIAGIRDRIGVSVADSHIGAVIQSASDGQITVVTSDGPADYLWYRGWPHWFRDRLRAHPAVPGHAPRPVRDEDLYHRTDRAHDCSPGASARMFS